MATLVTSGRTAIAASVKDRDIYMGWGSGNPSWDSVLIAETPSKDALLAPVGYRKLTESAFCLPDEEGGIVVPTGRFAISATPTNHLYLRFTFDFDDSPSAAIRETAVFVDTEVVSGLPLGQMYFAPGQVTDPGTMLLAENIAKINRTPATRETFEFVVTF